MPSALPVPRPAGTAGCPGRDEVRSSHSLLPVRVPSCPAAGAPCLPPGVPAVPQLWTSRLSCMAQCVVPPPRPFVAEPKSVFLQGGEKKHRALFIFPLPTWVNLFSFLTCQPEESSASNNGKLLSCGWGRRRGERMGKALAGAGRWGWMLR